MPYKSDAQRRWAHTEKGKEALGGEAAVHEWDEATKGKKLPEKVEKAEMNPLAAGSHKTSVKTPKQKHMPGPDAKPSVFFKGEQITPKHPSTQKLCDFMGKCELKKSDGDNLMKSEVEHMADEKKYSAREVALALLAKSQEMLAKTSLAPNEVNKVAEHQSGMHTVGYYSSAPFEKSESLDCGFEPFQDMKKSETGHEKGINTQSDPAQRSRVMMGTSKAGSQMPLSRDAATRHEDKHDAVKEHKKVLGEMGKMPKPNLPKSENPDEKQDAKLGEEVESLCEHHMSANKAAERKEGHKIVKSEACTVCKSEMRKTEFADLYETLAKIETLEKYEGEDPHQVNEVGTKIQKAEDKGQGSGIKKEPSNEMKHGVSEEQAPQRDAANFETQPGHASKPADHREAPQAAPDKNPAEQKEGNNPPPGSVPGKGVHKLSFFMGHRHHKNGMKKGIALG